MMRSICFLVTSLRTGGAEITLRNVIVSLNTSEFIVTVICLYEAGSIGEELSRSGYCVIEKLFSGRFDLLGLKKLYNVMINRDIDVVYILRDPLTLFYGMVIAKLARINCTIVGLHCMGYFSAKIWNYVIDFFFLRRADMIITVSALQKAFFARINPWIRKKMEVIPNGINVRSYRSLNDIDSKKLSLGLPANVPIVGMVGRLHPLKRHDIFIGAAKIVLEQVPDAIFLIVGEGGERKKISETITFSSLDKSIVLLGERVDVCEIDQVLSLGVNCSDSEVLPLSILEYMAAGLPVVATAVGAIPDLIEPGVNGLIIEKNNPFALADAILRFLRDPDFAKLVGLNNYAKAMQYYDQHSMVASYEEFFRLFPASRRYF